VPFHRSRGARENKSTEEIEYELGEGHLFFFRCSADPNIIVDDFD
jgi:hypothetical protein